jgi:ribonucleoside-diphosphate reductase alpha chain
MGLKAVAIYRDNCKVGQPLSMAKKDEDKKEEPATVASLNDVLIPRGAVRRRLPKVRTAKTFSFKVADSKGFFTVGEYEDGTPGELFVSISKQGSTLRGVMDAFAISISHGLQYGAPLKNYVRAFTNMSFAPAGITDDPEIRTSSSLVDYIFRRLALSYLSFDDRLELGLASIDDMPEAQVSLLGNPEDAVIEEAVQAAQVVEETPAAPAPKPVAMAVETPKAVTSTPAPAARKDDTAPFCYNCGNQTQRAGSCYVCTACGSTTGCS